MNDYERDDYAPSECAPTTTAYPSHGHSVLDQLVVAARKVYEARAGEAEKAGLVAAKANQALADARRDREAAESAQKSFVRSWSGEDRGKAVAATPADVAQYQQLSGLRYAPKADQA